MVLGETPEQAADFWDSASQMPRVPVHLEVATTYWTLTCARYAMLNFYRGF